MRSKSFSFDKKSLTNLVPFIKPYRLYLVGIITSLCLAAATLLSFGVGLKYLIDQGFSPKNQSLLNQSIVILLGISLLMAIASFSRYYLSTVFAERVTVDLKRAVFSKLTTFSPRFFEDFRVGEILSRLNTDTTLIRTALGAYASTGLRSVLQFFGALLMLFYTSPKLTGLLLVLIPFIIVPIFSLGKKVKTLGRTAQDGVGKEGAYIEETFGGIKTVQAFCRENLHVQIFNYSLEDSLSAAKRYIQLRSWLVAYIITTVFASISFLLWVGGYEVIKGRLTPGDLSSFVFFGFIAAASVNSTLELFSDMQRALAATDRLFDLLKRQPLIQNALKTYPLSPSAQGHLSIQNLTFCYPSRPNMAAVEAINLDIKPGEKLAIVGPSGAGKTTLFNLILRFYDPKEGGINLDNIDIKQLKLETLRSAIAIVPQDPYIFNASVYDNIAYGRYQATPEDIKRAADQAFASEFIDQLPEKYNTILGEKGVRLSGGQKQRLAIARAILKDPLLLLLDEATNALDAHSEHMVQKALEKVMQDRTTLIVAHRLSTVQSADRIVVLSEGKIAAMGTHHSLMEEGGLYQKLAQLQFAAG